MVQDNLTDSNQQTPAGQGDAAEPVTTTPDATDFNPEELTAPVTPPTTGPDPFDPASLKLTGTTAANIGVKKALLTIPTRKPDKSWFVRTHPDETYRLQTYLIELKEDRESYLISRTLWSDLSAEATFRPKLLITSINRQGVLFLWELNLPRSESKTDEWTRTGLEAAERAKGKWVRVVANMGVGGYELFEAAGQLSEPEWPSLTFAEILRIAFKDRYIDTLTHPVLRRLRGEV